MNRLKEIRAKFRLTQKDVAKELQTTQQTIARWEQGQDIPAAQLKELAKFFSCRVDDILGIELTPRARKDAAFANVEIGTPFGELKVKFQFGERAYPIDEGEQRRLADRLSPDFEDRRATRWFEFSAMDNRLVFIDLFAVESFHLTSDDIEEMPFYLSPETYEAMTCGTAREELGVTLQKERDRLVETLPSGSNLDTYALSNLLSKVTLIYRDGTQTAHLLTEPTVNSYYFLESDLEKAGPGLFLLVEDDHETHFVNMGSLVAVEVPHAAYSRLIADD